jgi:hypothetical protein
MRWLACSHERKHESTSERIQKQTTNKNRRVQSAAYEQGVLQGREA